MIIEEYTPDPILIIKGPEKKAVVGSFKCNGNLNKNNKVL